jgi:type II secretory pathway pseudopilin PulG
MIAAVCAVAVIVAAWLLMIQPKRNQASKLASQISSAQAQLSSARSTLAQNEAARGRFSGDYAELVRLGEAVPSDDNVASLIVELQSAASAAHVDFRDVTLQTNGSTGASSSSSSSSSPPSSSSSSSSSPASSGRSSSSRAAPSSTPAQTQSSSLPPGATVGPAGFPAEQFTLTFQGNFFNLANLLKRLQAFVTVNNKHVSVSGRLITLNAINLGAAPSGFPLMDATINATTYLVPASQGLLNGATPSSPGTRSTGAVPSSRQSSSSPAPATISAPTLR